MGSPTYASKRVSHGTSNGPGPATVGSRERAASSGYGYGYGTDHLEMEERMHLGLDHQELDKELGTPDLLRIGPLGVLLRMLLDPRDLILSILLLGRGLLLKLLFHWLRSGFPACGQQE